MRWSLLSIVVVLTGCLYVDGINHEPEGEIRLGTSVLQYGANGSVSLEAVVSDPDQDELAWQWRVKVTDLEQQDHQLTNPIARFVWGQADNISPLDPGALPGVIGYEETLTLSGLPSRGTYEVTLSAEDDQGAQHTVSKTFKVGNLAPEVQLLITGAPDSGFPGAPRYPGHAHYQVRVVEDPLKNPEYDLVCGGKATIAYSVDPAFSAKLSSWSILPCQGKEWLDRLSFRLKDDAVAAQTKFKVQAVIDDGRGGKTTAVQTIALWPNRPPCIVATDPGFTAVSSSAQTAVVPVLASQPRSFAVTTYSEDVNTGLRYSWWVKDESAGAFDPILEGAVGGELSLPAWFRLPGEHIELRVMVQETEGAAPSCPTQSARCSAGDHPAACYRWVTWKVKFI